MSLLMEIVSLSAESGRSPRLPGSNTVPFGQDLCAFASLRLCVNFFIYRIPIQEIVEAVMPALVAAKGPRCVLGDLCEISSCSLLLRKKT